MSSSAVNSAIAGVGNQVSDALRSITLTDGLHKAQLLSVTAVSGAPKGDFSYIMPNAGVDPAGWPMSTMNPYLSSTLSGSVHQAVMNTSLGPVQSAVTDTNVPYFIAMAVLPV
jgi:hypothetical protein